MQELGNLHILEENHTHLLIDLSCKLENSTYTAAILIKIEGDSLS
jgi:hypothetical protein